MKRMKRKQSGHEGAAPKHPRHSVHGGKQQKSVCQVKQKVYAMMCAWRPGRYFKKNSPRRRKEAPRQESRVTLSL
jgi:hypothetical protein